MAINRYFNPVPLEAQLYTPPVEFIAKALEGAQKQYDTNFQFAEQMKGQYIDALPQDRARANELQNEISSGIDKIVQKYSGDYSQATKDLYLLKTEAERKFKPGSEGYAIAQNFKLYTEGMKEAQARLAKGEINQTQFELWRNKINSTYQGVKPDEVTGAYNPIQLESLAPFADSNKIVNEALDKLKPREVTRVQPTRDPSTGMIVLNKTTESAIDEVEAYGAMQTALLQDDKFMSYWIQINRLAGTDPEVELQKLLNQYAQTTLPAKSGIFKSTQDIDLKEDPIARDQRALARQRQLEELRFRNRVRFDKYKREADDKEAYDDTELSVLGRTRTGFQAYKPVDYEGGLGLGWLGPLPGLANKPKLDVDQVLNSRQRQDINYPLLKAIRQANPNRPSTDVWEIYNDSVTKGINYGEDIYYTRFSTTPAQTEEADRVVPSLLTGQVPIYEFDPKTGSINQIIEASDRIEKAKKWYNPETRKAKVKALGKTSIQTGHLPFGTILQSDDGKYYVAADMGVKMYDMNMGTQGDPAQSIRGKLFGFIQDPKAEFSEPVELPTADGKGVQIMGVKEYNWDPNLKAAIPQVNYYEVKWTMGGFVPDMNDPNPLTPDEVERLLIPYSELFKRFPKNKRSASSEENVPLEAY